TDDPSDTLEFHQAIAKSRWKVKVFPAFRPDNALRVNEPVRFKNWVKALSDISGTNATRFNGYLKALKLRHDFFHSNGCRLSDHGLNRMPLLDCTERRAATTFSAALKGQAASPEDADRFASFMLEFFGGLGAEKKWTQQ